MPDGQEYAVVLPQGAPAQVFASSYYSSRATAVREQQQRDLLAYNKQKTAVEAEEKKRKNEDETIKYAYENILTKTDPTGIARDMGVKIKDEALASISTLVQTGKASIAQLAPIASAAAMKIQSYNEWGKSMKESIALLEKEYGGIEGVNSGAISGLLLQKMQEKNMIGTGPVDVATLAPLVKSIESALVQDNKGLLNWFKRSVGTENNSNVSGSNLRKTSTGLTLDRDSEVVNGKIVPIGQRFNVLVKPTTATTKVLSQDISKMQEILKDQADAEGNVGLYSKEDYDKLMSDRAASMWVEKEFKEVMQKHANNPRLSGMVIDDQMQELIKRAIVYNQRKLMLDSKQSSNTLTREIVFGSGGGSGGGGGKTPATPVPYYEELKKKLAPYVNNRGVAIPFNVIGSGPQMNWILKQTEPYRNDAAVDGKYKASDVAFRVVDGVIEVWSVVRDKKGKATTKEKLITINKDEFNAGLNQNPKNRYAAERGDTPDGGSGNNWSEYEED